MAHTARKWSANVKTDSTHPPQGLFNRDPETIARTLASEKVSPKGARLGHENAVVLHQPRRQKPERH
jgi:hypothetical protein